MSRSWDDLVRRVEGLEREFKRRDREAIRPAASRRVDADLRRTIERLARYRVTIPVGSLGYQQPEFVLTSFVWSSSYATGGEATTFQSLFPTLLGVLPFPKGGYTFHWDSGTEKLLAYDSGGAETAPATNLSAAIASSQVLVMGTRNTDTAVYQAGGDERLIRAWVTVTDAHAFAASDYWTLEILRRRPRQPDGTPVQSDGEVLDRYVTSSTGLSALEPHVIYSNELGLPLGAGEFILLRASPASGLTVSLTDVTVTLELQRTVT